MAGWRRGYAMNRMPDFGRMGEHLWYAQGFLVMGSHRHHGGTLRRRQPTATPAVSI